MFPSADQTPFLLSNAPVGEIIPELKIVGTLGSHPLSQIELKNARVFLPFTTMTVASGHIDFTQGKPLDAATQLRSRAGLGLRVQACALLDREKRQLILRSDPPLSQDALISCWPRAWRRVYMPARNPDWSRMAVWRPLGAKLDSPTTGKDSLTNGPLSSSSFSAYPGTRSSSQSVRTLARAVADE
jgi:hypothetical protein